MNVVVIIPTGLGAKIGGGCGDGCPIIRAISSICDNVITHPNVVNAADLNEMTENTWYVEGSTLDDFLEGKLRLKRPRMNRILLLVNEITNETANSVGAARASLGVPIFIEKLRQPLKMKGEVGTCGATGSATGIRSLIAQARELQGQYDALAIQTPIDIDRDVAEHYLRSGTVNPWGKAESIVSRAVATALNVPVAHAPFESGVMNDFKEIVSDSKAAEMVSVSYLHCILKGLSKAPRINMASGLSVDDIDVMISPHGCIGRPHFACFKKSIPVIVVRSNTTVLNDIDQRAMYVESYMEAFGLVACIKSGVGGNALRVTNTDG